MNSELDRQIIEGFIELSGKRIPQVFTAIVDTVDEGKRIMSVKKDEITISNIRLQAVTGESSGTLLIPSSGSYVTIGRIEGLNSFVLLSTTKLDKIITDCDSIVFNGGNNDGLVIASKIVSEMNKMQDSINDLKQIFNTWTPVPNDGGAALFALLSAWKTQMIAKTTKSNIENTKIKH